MLYQTWASQKIAAGTTIATRIPHFENGRYTVREQVYQVATLEPHEMVDVYKKEGIDAKGKLGTLQSNKGKLLHFRKPNHPLFDAAVCTDTELILLQMTIGETHDNNIKTFEEFQAAAQEAKLERMRFIFVVPDRNKFSIAEKVLTDCVVSDVGGFSSTVEVMELAARNILSSKTP